MPQNNTSKTPPKVMTWPKAIMPVLLVAGIFDLVRAFFNLFWFFGPAIAALYCSSTVSGWVGSLWGLTKAACGTAAVVGGVYFSPIIASFGVIMADAVAFLGYLVLLALVLSTNSRIIKTVQTAIMQIGASFGVAALPLIGAIPTFSITLYKLYRRQIKLEKAAYKKWEKAHTDERIQQRQERAAELMRAQAGQQDQTEEAESREVTSDEVSAETEQEKGPPEVVGEDEETFEPPTAQGIQRPSIGPSYTVTSEAPPSSPQKHSAVRSVSSAENKKVEPVSRKIEPAEGTYRPAPTRTIPQLTMVPNYTGTNETPPSSPQKSPEIRNVSTASEKVEPVNIPQKEFAKIPVVPVGDRVADSYTAPSSVMKTKESSFPEPIRQTYDQGIERLRKDVLSVGSEHTEVFVVKKDGTSSWLTVPENSDKKVESATIPQKEPVEKAAALAGDSASVPAEKSASEKFIKDIADDGTVDHFDIVHIRPSQSVTHDSSQAPQTQKEEFVPLAEPVPLATPPKMSDLVDMVVGDEGGGEVPSHRPGTIVVDPTGVWKAELVGDPKTLLSAKQRPQVSKKPSMSDFISKIEMISGQNITLDTDEKLKEMQDIYNGVGVNLTFTPHPKESNEIPEGVREAM